MEKLIIFVILTGAAHAFFPIADINCNATQTSRCFVTIGGTVSIQVMSNASDYHVRCKKALPSGNVNVFNSKNNKVKILDPFKNRTQFLIDSGTIKINNVQREDFGEYTVEIYDLKGIQLKAIILQLDGKENIFPILIPVCAAVGSLVILAICCCLCCWWRRRKRQKIPSGTSSA